MQDKSLKIKFSHGPVSIELEGEPHTVLEEVNKLRVSGIGRMVEFFRTKSLTQDTNTINETLPTRAQSTAKAEAQISKSGDTNTEFNNNITSPTLHDIVYKRLARSESEWILVYSYFASESGKKPFTRDSILALYKNPNRLTETNKKNLSNSIKQNIHKGWISRLNDDEFSILEEGRSKALEIISRSSSAQKTKNPKTRSQKQEDTPIQSLEIAK